MKDEDQIKAIAELDGWTFSIGNPATALGVGFKFRRSDTTPKWELAFPNYLTSRDVIVPVIEKQPVSIKVFIATWIYQQSCISTGESWTQEEVIAVMLATPRQLCEALLRATGKWTE